MNRKCSSSAPRTANLRKPNLPHLSRLRGHSETPTSLKTDLNTYTLIQDNSFNLNSVRKFFTPTNIAKTAIPSSFRIDTEFKEELSTKPAVSNSFWEIKERTESYEMRIKGSFKQVTEEFTLWNQCCLEVIPLIKQHSQDLGEVFTKLTGNLCNLFKELEKESQEQQKRSKLDCLGLKKKIKGLEEECLGLKGVIEGLKNTERLEMEQIQKEIDEIFGPEDMDLQLEKYKRTMSEQGASTADYLQQVYNTMNKEYMLPEKHSFEFPKFSAAEFDSALLNKFKSLQKSTAYRVMKMMEGKNRVSSSVQTIANYVNPKDYEDLQANVEKMNIQYQAALMQIERFREDSSQKHQLGEQFETQKVALLGEVSRLKRELEGFNKENSALKNEVALVKNELSLKESKTAMAAEMEILVTNLNIKLANTSKKNETLTATVKEKEEEIQELREKLEKSKFKRPEKSEDPDLSSLYKSKEKMRESYQDPQAESTPFDDLFAPSSVKRNKLQGSKNTIRGSNNSESKSTVKDLSEDQDQLYPLPLTKSDDESLTLSEKSSVYHKSSESHRTENPGRAAFYSEARTSSTTPADKSKPNIEANLPTRVNSRDTPLARVDEIKELKHKDLTQGKETKEVFSKSEKKIQDAKKNFSTEKKQEKYPKKNADKDRKQSFNRYESEEDYQVNRSMQWETADNAFDQGEERVVVGKDGLEYRVSEKGVWTNDLKMIQVTNFSKGVQVADGHPLESSESKKSVSRGIYFLPYNPNNAYGLRGETYFHGKNQVFAPQPRIPDLANSVLFQQSYFLDKPN